MDLQTCLKKLQYVGVLAFATVDGQGNPQVRNISAIHYEPDAIYFFTARGKDFCRELLADGRVQILGYTRYKEMIRLSAKAVPVPEPEQEEWIDQIFSEQPYLANVYPGDTRKIGIVFRVSDGEVEYFNLGVRPILRGQYPFGGGKVHPAGSGSQIQHQHPGMEGGQFLSAQHRGGNGVDDQLRPAQGWFHLLQGHRFRSRLFCQIKLSGAAGSDSDLCSPVF